MDNHPNEPLDVRTMAIMAHEYYTSMKAAGFSIRQSIYLTACMLTGGPKVTPEDED